MHPASATDPRRALPSADAVLAHPAVRPLLSSLSQDVLIPLLHAVKAACPLTRDPQEALDRVAAEVARLAAPLILAPRRLVNATGTVIHTGLGTAPLSPRAAARALEAAAATPTGAPGLGGRHDTLHAILAALSGAEAACVTCQTAASLVLLAAALAPDREIVCAARDLLEIGHGARIADLLASGGARVVPVGSANAVHLQDYARALSPRAALILRVWHSNYAASGYVAHVPAPQLARLARDSGIPLAVNLGAGTFVDLRQRGLPHSPTIQEALSWGADIVLASGDKLVGGPQSGIIVGRADLVGRLLAHPLHRALRPAKLDIAALEGTLASYLAGRAWEEIPVLRMLAAPESELRSRAERLAAAVTSPALRAEAAPDVAVCGGAALPDARLPTWIVRLSSPSMSEEDLFTALLARGVVARRSRKALALDLRSVLPEDDPAIEAALQDLRA